MEALRQSVSEAQKTTTKSDGKPKARSSSGTRKRAAAGRKK
jgi:hypothetical protein